MILAFRNPHSKSVLANARGDQRALGGSRSDPDSEMKQFPVVVVLVSSSFGKPLGMTRRRH
jgi:hypothetical protein